MFAASRELSSLTSDGRLWSYRTTRCRESGRRTPTSELVGSTGQAGQIHTVEPILAADLLRILIRPPVACDEIEHLQAWILAGTRETSEVALRDRMVLLV